MQKKMISEIIHGDKIANIPLAKYSEVASGKELRVHRSQGRECSAKEHADQVDNFAARSQVFSRAASKWPTASWTVWDSLP